MNPAETNGDICVFCDIHVLWLISFEESFQDFWRIKTFDTTRISIAISHIPKCANGEMLVWEIIIFLVIPSRSYWETVVQETLFRWIGGNGFEGFPSFRERRLHWMACPTNSSRTKQDRRWLDNLIHLCLNSSINNGAVSLRWSNDPRGRQDKRGTTRSHLQCIHPLSSRTWKSHIHVRLSRCSFTLVILYLTVFH